MSQTARLLSLWREDPLAFCGHVFQEPPREFQPELLRLVAGNRFTAIKSARDVGKTRTAAYAALWFLCTRPGSLVFTVAPIWRQIENLWTEVRTVWTASRLPEIFPSWEMLNTQLRTTRPNWRAMGVASDSEERLEGEHGNPTLVIVDEAKAVSDATFNSLQGMLSGPESKFVAISTPGIPSGWFYRAFSSEREYWNVAYTIRADQVDRLKDRLEREKERLGESNPHFRSQLMAEFAATDEATLFRLSTVEAATTRVFEPSGSWKKILALDPAGKGADDSVLSYRHGPNLLRQEAWNGADPMVTVGRTVQAVREWGPAVVVVDECGLGSPILSRLQEVLAGQSVSVKGFNSGHAAKDRERFHNAKSEVAFQIRERFEKGEIAIPNDPGLIAQLLSIRVETSSTGKTKTVDPPDSPDKADSLLLAFAADWRGPGYAVLDNDYL